MFMLYCSMVKVKSILRLHHYKLFHEAHLSGCIFRQIEANSFYRICHIHDVERKSFHILCSTLMDFN